MVWLVGTCVASKTRHPPQFTLSKLTTINKTKLCLLKHWNVHFWYNIITNYVWNLSRLHCHSIVISQCVIWLSLSTALPDQLFIPHTQLCFFVHLIITLIIPVFVICLSIFVFPISKSFFVVLIAKQSSGNEGF